MYEYIFWMDYYNFACYFAYLLLLSKPLHNFVAENINLLFLLDLCPLDLVGHLHLRHLPQLVAGSVDDWRLHWIVHSHGWQLMLPVIWKFSWGVSRIKHTWLIHVAWVLHDFSVEFCEETSQEQAFQETQISYASDLEVTQGLSHSILLARAIHRPSSDSGWGEKDSTSQWGCCNQLWSYLINHTAQTIYIPHTWNRYSSPLKALKHSMRFSITNRFELLEELILSNTEVDALYKWSSSGVDPWARLSLSHPFFLWEMSCFCSWVAFQHASSL